MAANWRDDWKEDLAKALAWVLIGGLCAAGIGMLSANGKNFWIAVKPGTDVEYLMDNGGAREGMHVTGQVPYVYGCFANLSYLEGDKASAYYYAIPSGEDLMILSVPETLYDTMEALWEETWEYVEGGSLPVSTVRIEGYVTKAKGRLPYLLAEYMQEYLGYTREEVDAMGEPLMVQYANEALQRARISAPVGMILLTSGILLLLLYVFVIKRRLFR